MCLGLLCLSWLTICSTTLSQRSVHQLFSHLSLLPGLAEEPPGILLAVPEVAPSPVEAVAILLTGLLVLLYFSFRFRSTYTYIYTEPHWILYI
jgi:hypothetical protein